MNNNLISPCISICRTDPLTGYCYGCARTNEEKVIWKSQDTLNTWKEENLKILRERLSGWQKDAFNKSYLCKQETGMSLIKKKLMENKNS
tara:strand:+ start:2760 stop:3029 length:270 start_codon:yes stop_codon:yes gene_type:complete